MVTVIALWIGVPAFIAVVALVCIVRMYRSTSTPSTRPTLDSLRSAREARQAQLSPEEREFYLREAEAKLTDGERGAVKAYRELTNGSDL